MISTNARAHVIVEMSSMSYTPVRKNYAKYPRKTYLKKYSKVYNKRNPPQKSLIPYPEVKTFDIGDPARVLAVASVMQFIEAVTLIPPGTNGNQRVGRRIQAKSYILNWVIAANTGVFRFMVVYDKQSNGVATPISEVLNAVTPQITDLYQADNQQRFVILLDKYVTPEQDRAGTEYVKLNLPVTYPDVVGTPVPNTGSIQLFVAATANLTFGFAHRLRFLDA